MLTGSTTQSSAGCPAASARTISAFGTRSAQLSGAAEGVGDGDGVSALAGATDDTAGAPAPAEHPAVPSATSRATATGPAHRDRTEEWSGLM
ncbi:hypothetical protein GCM10009869_26460 [Amnibacterium kyonggiense]